MDINAVELMKFLGHSTIHEPFDDFLNNEIPHIRPIKNSKVLICQINSNEFSIVGNKNGLLVLAKALLGVAASERDDGYHFHFDDLYNDEKSSITISKLT